jgi:hypothetical protein
MAWTFTPFTSPVSTSASAMGASDLARATRAWNEFEAVEAADSATRSTAIGGGATASVTWYAFAGEGERRLYRDGQQMHALAIPGTNWQSTRSKALTPAQVSTLEVLVATPASRVPVDAAADTQSESDRLTAATAAAAASLSAPFDTFTDLLLARIATVTGCDA